MRTSGDIDCLVQEEKLYDAVEALKSIGYVSNGQKSYHDIELDKADIHLELHFNICENKAPLDRILKTVWDNVKAINEFEMEETTEFFVFHHIAHMAYHILTGGCGIRPFIDLWIMKKRFTYDNEEVRYLCEKAEISKFFDLVNKMVYVWFENGLPDQESLAFEKFIIDSSLFGTNDSRNNVATIQKYKTKGNIYHHLFLPYDQMKERYPSLNKWPFLLPLFGIYRLFQKLFDKKQREYLQNVINSSKDTLDVQTLEVINITGLGGLLQ